MPGSSRTLIYIPILHTGIDMGQFAPLVDDAAQANLGADTWQRHVTDVEHMWDGIEEAIPRLGLDLKSLRVYQDGLPVCGREFEIVDDLAKTGSRNHLLLQTLSRQGASVVGTEAPELLVEEYELAWRLLNAPSANGHRTDAERRLAADLLQRRDRFIARRIDETLPAGGTGMLFIGALHRVAPLLPADLAVSYPLGSPAI
ncbi:hypothetical protein QZM22_08435 [Burkholderia oklahomensis]|uniref:hypothetical protein n=1 Tax=Burkholderia oklahomensis TaxID=342113 RepID=UPI0026529337|nr:hypothetical protein [Burkholderia oklahomensis]MDN7672540.1 hypothetical protein [Burkholderia oklahomensis]